MTTLSTGASCVPCTDNMQGSWLATSTCGLDDPLGWKYSVSDRQSTCHSSASSSSSSTPLTYHSAPSADPLAS